MRRAFKFALFLAVGLAMYPFLRVEPETPAVSETAKLPATETIRKEAQVQEPIRRDIRNVTPPGMLQAPKLEGETILREPAKLLPKPPPRPPQPDLYARPIVEAAGIVRSGKVTIRIADVQALGIDESCAGSDGRTWPCGIHGKTALQRLIRQRTISCDPSGFPDGNGGVARRCAVGGIDIARWLVEQGWAIPDGRSDLAGSFQTARESKRGQWGDAPR
jgi:endonuclease YncB( thermonuclease family)